ncbi:hypothetical protein JB92DRAFT_2832831 [Gautieria morchelliformis]|nr:hypothetical protein JB92DRAFT_2832831 [Gautieria morchelliformis]
MLKVVVGELARNLNFLACKVRMYRRRREKRSFHVGGIPGSAGYHRCQATLASWASNRDYNRERAVEIYTAAEPINIGPGSRANAVFPDEHVHNHKYLNTSPKPPKTTTTPPSGTLTIHNASLRSNDTTDILARAQRACVGYPVGRGVSKRIAGRVCRLVGGGTAGEEVQRLIKAICSTGVAGDGQCGRGGRGVGVVGGRMGSTRDRERNEAGWKRRDWRKCVLVRSGAARAARAADGEQAGWLASVTPRCEGVSGFFPIFPSVNATLTLTRTGRGQGQLENMREGRTLHI